MGHWKTIAWDVDDVLNDLMRAWLEWYQIEISPKGVNYEELTENPPHLRIGISLEEYLGSLDRFRGIAYGKLVPEPEVQTWFERHGAAFQHIAVTAVPLHSVSASAAWVTGNFGRWLRTYHFLPSPRPWDPVQVYDESKADFLIRFGGIDLFVDDQPGNVTAARKAGIPCVTWPRPWNDNGATVKDTLGTMLDVLEGRLTFSVQEAQRT